MVTGLAQANVLKAQTPQHQPLFLRGNPLRFVLAKSTQLLFAH